MPDHRARVSAVGWNKQHGKKNVLFKGGCNVVFERSFKIKGNVWKATHCRCITKVAYKFNFFCAPTVLESNGQSTCIQFKLWIFQLKKYVNIAYFIKYVAVSVSLLRVRTLLSYFRY